MGYLQGDVHGLGYYRLLLLAALSLSRAAVKIPNPEVEIRAICYQFHCMSWPTFCPCKCHLEMHFFSAGFWPKGTVEDSSKRRKVLSRMVIMQVCFVSLSNWCDLSKLYYSCTLSLFSQTIIFLWRVWWTNFRCALRFIPLALNFWVPSK